MEKIKLLRQPEGSSLCGQTCVAMLANKTLEESIKEFNTRGGTTTKQVIHALKSFKIDCADKLIRLTNKSKKPPLCIVVLHFKDSNNKHWTIYNHGIFYDPDVGIVFEYPKEYVRETSYLEIYE